MIHGHMNDKPALRQVALIGAGYWGRNLARNFNQLEAAWRFKTDMLGPRPEYKLEGTPLAINGVLYTTGGTRRSERPRSARRSSFATASSWRWEPAESGPAGLAGTVPGRVPVLLRCCGALSGSFGVLFGSSGQPPARCFG